MTGDADFWLMTKTAVYGFMGVAFVFGVSFWAYLSQARLKKFRNRKAISMVRNEHEPHTLKVLELSDTFRKANPDWKLYSLGQYLSQLQVNILSKDIPMDEIPCIIRERIDAALTAALLKALGPTFGTTLLPLLGMVPTDGPAGYMFSMISGALITKATGKTDEVSHDQGRLPLTMGMLGNGADLYATSHRNSTSKGEPVDLGNPKRESPLGMYEVGETGYNPHFGMKHGEKDPTCADRDALKPLIPNPFIMSKDWDEAISGMEENIRHTRGSFDPESRALGEPVAVNETLLPDLYAGWGEAKGTHTQREIVRHRLVASILNRLGHNYHIQALKLKGENVSNLKQFVVRMKSGGPDMTKPSEFIQALVDSGHSITCCARGATTTFGSAFCVKNKNGEWYNIPLAFFFQSGFESEKGVPAMFYLPHSGMDMEITGPLFPTTADGIAGRCNIQYYLAIEGMAGWHSNHNADVPWIKAVDCSKPFKGEEMLRVVTYCAMGALTLNTLSTDMSLPNGGYGLVGVCNDTVAVIELAMTGSTNVHPITYSGRFLMHTARYAFNIAKVFAKDKDLKKETECLKKLYNSMISLPNDQSATPVAAKGSLKRMLTMMPPYAHQMTIEAKEIIEVILNELEDFTKPV